MMMKKATNPGGEVFELSYKLLSGHTLIAGITGSGKSVLINHILGDVLAYHPTAYSLILIDPKRVELYDYRTAPHTLRYADETAEAVEALRYALNLTESRYKRMRRRGLKTYDGGAVIVVVDELADLMTTARKQCLPLLQRIAQIGRAAKVYLLTATQSPSRKTIPAELTLNFQNRVALHCAFPIESRQIIGGDEATTLPAYGEAYLRTASGELVHITQIPPPDPAKIAARLAWWETQTRRRWPFRR